MIAREAPEKLYISYEGFGCFKDDGSTERMNNSQVEYTRTDAFIEKACEWLKDNLKGVCGGSIYIEDFKKAMEE